MNNLFEKVSSSMRPVMHPQNRDPEETFPLDGKDLSSVTNKELVAIVESARAMYQVEGTKVVRLSKHLVVKCGTDVLVNEANMLNVIASQTRIRVPRVHNSFEMEDKTSPFDKFGYIVMDFVQGRPLNQCWASLPSSTKENIADQTATMIKEMQSIEFAKPGPIGGGKCRGRIFTNLCAGPFTNIAQMEAWFNHRLGMRKTAQKAPSDMPPFHFTKLVLTHHDICPRNLILDDHEQVWLIDWELSGAYPPAFENSALLTQVTFSDFGDMVLSRVQRYPDEERQLVSMACGLTTLK